MFASLELLGLLVAQGAQPTEGASSGADQGAMYRTFGMIAVIAVIWIVMMWLPQRKEQQRAKAMLDGLKKNDRVLLSSGIIGIVMSAQPDDKFIAVRVDETTGAKLRVLRSSVVQVVGDEAES